MSVLIPINGFAEAWQSLPVDPARLWFKPTLVEDNDPLCTVLIEAASDRFQSELDLHDLSSLSAGIGQPSKVPGEYWSDEGLHDPNMEIEEFGAADKGINSTRPILRMNGVKIYLASYTNPGCGGACEEYGLLTSLMPIVDRAASPSVHATRSYSYDPQLLKRNAAEYFYLSMNSQEYLSLERLQPDARWTTACRVQLRQHSINGIDDPALQAAYDAIGKLSEARRALARGAGSCGSMRTHGRWGSRFSDLSFQILYRPWAMNETATDREEYQADLAGLRAWSLMGISEYRAMRTFEVQFEQTSRVVADYFERRFAWNAVDSRLVARRALRTAVNSTIRFYMFSPYTTGEAALRQAILDGTSLEQIKSLPFEQEWTAPDRFGESLLGASITRSEIIAYLLGHGADPDPHNAFGKTPLMYAAQYNQIESARLLLTAGADPNATTTRPDDNCYYTLHTFNMTPLHYAARYASPEFIRLLIEHGAMPFFRTENHRQRPMTRETPLDWLHRHVAADAEERNPHIPDQRVKEVADWLKLPSPEVIASLSHQAVLEAERLYAAGETNDAYRQLRRALEIDPANERALSDMSLVALRNGQHGESLAAGKKLIETSTDAHARARAWFNQGLACEQGVEARSRGLFYDGNRYCTSGVVYPLLQALALDDTESRKRKLIELFDRDEGEFCAVSYHGGTIRINFQVDDDPDTKERGQRQSFYVFHASGMNIDGHDFAWQVQFSGEPQPRRVVPEKQTTLMLGDYALTVLRTKETIVQFPYRFGGHVCTARNQRAVPANSTGMQ